MPTPTRFTAIERGNTWTVGDHRVTWTDYVAPKPQRYIVHKAHWPETTARHIAEVLNAHPYHADEWEWEA